MDVETPIGDPPEFHKQVRDLTSGEVISQSNDQPVAVVVPWQDKDLGVVDIQSLASAFISNTKTDASKFTSAQFALEMIKGVQKVRFTSTK